MGVIRVLQVLDKLSLNSGVCSVVMNYYDNIDHNKIIFDFLVHEDTPLYFKEKLESNGSRIYQMPELKTKNLLKYVKTLNKFFNNHKEYKIVHGHIANAAIFYLSMAKWNGVPVRIIHSHNSQGADKFYKKLRNYALNLPIKGIANYYFACSDKAAAFLFGENYINYNVKILNNAINVNKYAFNIDTRAKLRNKLNINNKFVIGHVGRFSNQKNHYFLIDIFNEIHKSNQNTILMLIGKGELEQNVKEKVHALDLDNSVLFMGLRNDVDELMQVMDVFVLPSLFEGLPVVGIEAQASGLPCLFSKNITKQADITSSVIYLDINSGVEVWKNEILKLKGKRRLAENADKIKVADFDIMEQCKVLSNFYSVTISKFI